MAATASPYPEPIRFAGLDKQRLLFHCFLMRLQTTNSLKMCLMHSVVHQNKFIEIWNTQNLRN